MLERFQKMLDDIKTGKVHGLQEFNTSFIINVFEMIDVNKWLKFSATTEEQRQNAQRIEESLNSTLEKLYVPLTLTTNA